MAFDYSIRLLRNRRLRGRSAPAAPAPFVVGVGRSGTTLLRMMLDAHRELAIPPETHFVLPIIQASGRIRFNPSIAARSIVRDERRRWNDFGLEQADLLARFEAIEPFNTTDALRAFYLLYAEKRGKEPVPPRELARRWRKRIIKSREDAAEIADEDYLEVRYEDLVRDTEGVLRGVCELVELDFDPAMLDYHERAEERLQEMAGALPAKK